MRKLPASNRGEPEPTRVTWYIQHRYPTASVMMGGGGRQAGRSEAVSPHAGSTRFQKLITGRMDFIWISKFLIKKEIAKYMKIQKVGARGRQYHRKFRGPEARTGGDSGELGSRSSLRRTKPGGTDWRLRTGGGCGDGTMEGRDFRGRQRLRLKAGRAICMRVLR